MTPQEFSTKIKEKYPQYADIDDIELAKKMIEKYPVYADNVNFEEVKPETPSSLPMTTSTPQTKAGKVLEKTSNIADKFLGGLYKFSGMEAAGKLLGSAAEGAAYGMSKLGSLLPGKFGETQKKIAQGYLDKPMTSIQQKAATQGTKAALKDIAGSSIEAGLGAATLTTGGGVNAAKVIPTALATKFPTLARYLGYGLTGATYGGGFGAGSALQDDKKVKEIFKETFKGAAAGAITGVAVPALIEGSVRAFKNVSALYSGVPKEALEQAFNNPEKVGEAARKYAKDSTARVEILDKAQKSFEDIKQVRQTNYKNAMAEIQKDIKVENGKLFMKNDKGIFQPTELSLNGIKKEMNKTIGEFNPKILNKSENAQIEELKTLVNEWEDVTPVGLNELKIAIDNRRNATNSKYLNKIYTTVKNNVVDYVNKKAPKIGAMNQAYSQSSEFIDDLQREIFGNAGKSDSSKLNALLNVFKQQSDIKRQLVEKLGKVAGTDLINEITGAALATWLPTNWVQRFIVGQGGASMLVGGLTGINPLTILPAAAAASPRIIGKAARVVGQAARILPVAGGAMQAFGAKASEKLINK